MKTKRWMAAALSTSLQPLPPPPWARLSVALTAPPAPPARASAPAEPLGTAC